MNTLILKKVAITAGIVASGLGLTGALAYAQGAVNHMNLSINNSGNVQLTGQVTANANSTLSVSSWLGTWTVNTSSSTNFSPNIGSASEINVGDTVSVSGTAGTGMVVNANKVKDLSLKTRAFVGTTSNVNATAGTFTLDTEHQGDVNVKTDSATQVFINGITSVFANLTNGIKTMVKGTVNANGSIQADVIRAPAPQNDDENDDNDSKRWFHLNIFKKLHLNNK